MGWCLGEGRGTGIGGSSKPPPDMSRWVWQFRHSHSFFSTRCGVGLNPHRLQTWVLHWVQEL